jgi:hypothetical protein
LVVGEGEGNLGREVVPLLRVAAAAVLVVSFI